MTKLIGIVAVDSNYGIGNDGKVLPFPRDDMLHFQETVKGQVVLCTGSTYKAMRKGTIEGFVYSRTPIYYASAKAACSSARYLLNRAKSHASKTNRDVYLCGGPRLYDLFKDEVDEWILTLDEATYTADSYLPWIANLFKGDDWSIVHIKDFTPTVSLYRITKNVNNVTTDVV